MYDNREPYGIESNTHKSRDIWFIWNRFCFVYFRVFVGRVLVCFGVRYISSLWLVSFSFFFTIVMILYNFGVVGTSRLPCGLQCSNTYDHSLAYKRSTAAMKVRKKDSRSARLDHSVTFHSTSFLKWELRPSSCSCHIPCDHVRVGGAKNVLHGSHRISKLFQFHWVGRVLLSRREPDPLIFLTNLLVWLHYPLFVFCLTDGFCKLALSPQSAKVYYKTNHNTLRPYECEIVRRQLLTAILDCVRGGQQAYFLDGFVFFLLIVVFV